jgi:hypothetical protein
MDNTPIYRCTRTRICTAYRPEARFVPSKNLYKLLIFLKLFILIAGKSGKENAQKHDARHILTSRVPLNRESRRTLGAIFTKNSCFN